MKNYTITVNGKAYDVTVEEKGGAATPVAAPVAMAPAAPAAAPAAPVAAPAPAAAPAGGAGSVKVTAGAAGKVFSIPTSVGQSVKSGDTVIVIEAMKMEIPVVAPEDGTIASIDVAVGDAVEAGTVMATLN
ncbi:MAG: biotin/lipoyl-containing protein [Faecalimonas sp.]|nr:biotin/lipoyl-containing protein [Faecalimonas sp.]